MTQDCNQGDETVNSFIAVGADELTQTLGRLITCPSCGEKHEIKCSSEDPVNKGKAVKLQFYKCGEKTFLAGINGKRLMPNSQH